MKVKTPVKVFLILLVAVGAFFVIRNYQKNHPSKTTVVTESDSSQKALDTATVVIPSEKPVKEFVKPEVETPAVIKAQKLRPKVVKVTKEKVSKPEVKKETTKPGERKNLEISNL